MADILIRGFEAPTNGFDCPLNTFGFCNLAQDETHYECVGDSRPKWCPLVPLSEGHGRLIDADEISSSLAESATFNYNKRTSVCWSDAFLSMIDMLDEVPTIVPAEGGVNDGKTDSLDPKAQIL